MTKYGLNRANNKRSGSAASTLCYNKMMRTKYTFRIDSEGNGYYILEGCKVSAKSFNQMYPLEIISNNNQLDSRSNFY